MSDVADGRLAASLLVATTLLLGACGPTALTPGPTTPPSSPASAIDATPPALTSAAPVSAVPASATAASTDFAFAADDIATYYETQGYDCASPVPSTTAAGFLFRSCGQTDSAGRTRVIGLVTDPSGRLANAFASVKGTAAEAILAPIDALDPLAGFLGTTLGEEQATALLTWLASHLGDTFAETTSGPLKIATYSESEADHSTLYVEVANQSYLDAPPAR